MILQCDQCNTRFRLDDSKLKPGGVKVRCSKCRHVFLAGAEQKHEESEFDAILSGLGAQAPQQQEQAAPVKQGAAAAGFAGEPAARDEAAEFGFDQEPAKGQKGAEFAFEEPAAGPEGAEFAFEEEAAPGPAVSQPDFSDFADFDFPTESLTPPEKPAPAQEQMADFDAFDFEPAAAPQAPAATLQQEAQAAPAAQGLDFGEFVFDEEPPAMKEEPAPAPDQALDFGDLSFEAEPAEKVEQPAPAAPGELDFGDFEFDATPAEKPQEPQTAPGDLDFGDFTFQEEPGVKEKEPQAAPGELDFGEFSFQEEPVKEKEPQAAPGELDFGEFSFQEEPGVKEKEPQPAAEALDFGEFSFEEPPRIQEAPDVEASAGFGSFSFDQESQQKQGEVAAPVPVPDEFSFEDYSLSDEFSAKGGLAGAEQAEPAGAPGIAGAAALFGAAGAAVPGAERTEPTSPPVIPAADLRKPPSRERTLDFGYDAPTVPSPGSELLVDEEELPPLSISSRRKGRSVVTVSIVAICVLVILALSGAGLYLLQSGPAALERFDKLGLGFVPGWFGMESVEEGRITVKNPLAAFHKNKEAGELFVVTGEAVNSFKKARASIQVKVSLFDKSGGVLLQKTAYCGNRLSNEQLATLPMAQIESTMNNQFGDSLANLGVKPGQSIGFVVAIPNVPKEAADFGVEVVGSTVAGQ